MVLKISVIAIFIYLLSGCALTNFVSEVKQAIEAKKIANDPNYIGINNPYYQKMQGIKVNVTTKDQVLTILGAPVLLTEHTETSFIGPRTVTKFEVWGYESDVYKTVVPPNKLVNGKLTIQFSGEKVAHIRYSEIPDFFSNPDFFLNAADPSLKKLQVERLRQMKEGEMELPVSRVQKILLGAMKGGACKEKIDLEIRIHRAHIKQTQIDGVARGTPGITVIGSFKSFKRTGLPSTQIIDIPLEGYYSVGFLHLASVNAKIEIELARDANGKGWAGVLVGDGFDDCSDIELVNENGTTTDELPPITGKLAFRRAENLYLDFAQKNGSKMDLTGSVVKIGEHWLNVAEKRGYTEALFALGQVYEQQGLRAPQYYPRALQYYRSSADKTGDGRAQLALGRMYAEGLGTPANQVEAQRWRNLAAKTRKTAAKLCSSPQAITAIRNIVQKEQAKLGLMNIGLAMMTGIQMDTGNIRLVKISVDDLVSLDKPFICKVEGKRIDPSVDASSVPDFVYGGTDQYGEYYYDNSLDKAGKTIIADVTENLLKNLPYVDRFRLEPLGGSRYKLSPSNTSRPYSETLELH